MIENGKLGRTPSSSDSFDRFFADAKQHDDYWVETAILDFTESLVARMNELNISNKALAKRLGKTPSYITKLLRGDNNFTIETMIKLSRALECRLSHQLAPDECEATISNSVCGGGHKGRPCNVDFEHDQIITELASEPGNETVTTAA